MKGSANEQPETYAPRGPGKRKETESVREHRVKCPQEQERRTRAALCDPATLAWGANRAPRNAFLSYRSVDSFGLPIGRSRAGTDGSLSAVDFPLPALRALEASESSGWFFSSPPGISQIRQFVSLRFQADSRNAASRKWRETERAGCSEKMTVCQQNFLVHYPV